MEQKKKKEELSIINQKDIIESIYVNYYTTLNLNNDDNTISGNITNVFILLDPPIKQQKETIYICLFVDYNSKKYKIYIGNRDHHYDVTDFFNIQLEYRDYNEVQREYEKQIHDLLQNDKILEQILAKMQPNCPNLTANVFLQRCEKYKKKEEQKMQNSCNSIWKIAKQNICDTYYKCSKFFY